LDQPGENLTGVTNGGSEPRRLERLVELVWGIQRVYIPYNPNDPSAQAALGSVQMAADELGIELLLQPASNDSEMAAAASAIPAEAEALFLLPDSLALSQTEALVAATLARKIPFSSPTVDQVENGALFSFGINLIDVGEQAARLADQILDGQAPADLPVEEAEFFLVINLTTAEAIGLTIPDEILNQASRLIRE
jgi:putative ABC transport system substrate-binding protein